MKLTCDCGVLLLDGEDTGVKIPVDRQEVYLEILGKLDPIESLSVIDNLAFYQKDEPNYPNHCISTYCIYLGTHEGMDLYSFHSKDRYSTAIVRGPDDHEYGSGWLSLALDGKMPEYAELFKRECACSLLAESAKMEVAEYYIEKVANEEDQRILKELRLK